MAIIVRTAHPDDAAAMGSLHVRAWQVGYRGMVSDAHLDSLVVEERAETWRHILTDKIRVDGVPPPLNVVATTTDGLVIGFASIGVDRDDPALGELWAMYVDPDHWRSGAGSALMAATFEELARLERDHANLWVLEDNDQARRFYEHHGWRSDEVVKTELFGDEPIRELRYSRSIHR